MHSPDCFQGSMHLLKSWKNLRANLTADLPDMLQLQEVVDFWSHAPISVRVLDWDDCASWPTAWNLIYQNKFDESAVSLGMFYTLIYAADGRWNADRLQLQLITDRRRCLQSIVLEVDSSWWLNLEYKQVVDKKMSNMEHTVQQRYGYSNGDHYLLNYQNMILPKSIITNDNTII